jgi:hypothetical protein
MEMTATLTETDAALARAFESALEVLSSIPVDVGVLGRLSEETLLLVNGVAAATREVARTQGMLIAGEVARRSAPELGSDGLAQRTGFRTAEEFVRVTARSTGREAVTAVRVGRLMVEEATAGEVNPVTGETVVASRPWLTAVAAGLRGRTLSVDAADAIAGGLGVPNSAVTVTQLAIVAGQLCLEAAVLDPDRLFKRSRQLRDELDVAGVALREEERHQQRSLKIMVTPSGMGRLVWVMDPETLAIVKETYDRATSPKRGGVRFVDGERRETAERILADQRTAEQLASDAFTELLQLGATTDPRFLLGKGPSQVRVVITQQAHDGHNGATPAGAVRGGAAHTGAAHIEGQAEAISITTVERLSCNGSTVETRFDQHQQPLDVGREQRYFTPRQRLALAVRDGGCRWPGCDRPPSWTEAHHTQFWTRDHGETNTTLGILLCKHHHLLAHNNGWEIHTHNGQFTLIPPTSSDPHQKPIPMPSKNPIIRGTHTTPPPS